MAALMATYFGSDDEEGLPEFIGLEGLPPPAPAPLGPMLVAAEEPEEELQPYEKVHGPPASVAFVVPGPCLQIRACMLMQPWRALFSVTSQALQKSGKEDADSLRKMRYDLCRQSTGQWIRWLPAWRPCWRRPRAGTS